MVLKRFEAVFQLSMRCKYDSISHTILVKIIRAASYCILFREIFNPSLQIIIPTSSDILLCSISIPVQISTDRKTSKIGTLLDTGSLAGDFISSRAFQTLNLSSCL